MSSFEITGGHRLCGEITPQGAKNEALQVLCAVLLTSDKVRIEHVPDIRDVNKLIELLKLLGVSVHEDTASACESGRTFEFQADQVNLDALHSPEFRQQAGALRGSIMLVGPLLTRFGQAIVPQPGGDKIGRRRLDTHFIGMERLGAEVEYKRGAYYVNAKRLKGTYMLLDEASVTGTANIVMAAVMARGTTTIMNAACEPYVYQLCNMLNTMGAKISGVGSNLLTIRGVKELHGCTHRLLPDMIEVGSFIGMAAMTQGDITIKNAQVQHLGLIPQVFRRLGIEVWQRGDDLYVPAQEHYEIERFMDGSIMTVADAPWPGFTPDLISIALVPPLLRRQTHRHGRPDHPLRPPPRHRHRPRPRTQTARRTHGLARHTRRRRTAHRRTLRRRHQPYRQHRANRPWLPAHRRASGTPRRSNQTS